MVLLVLVLLVEVVVVEVVEGGDHHIAVRQVRMQTRGYCAKPVSYVVRSDRN